MSKKENVKKVMIENDEDFLDVKKKDNNEKSKTSRIINVLLWVVLFAWMAICITDFLLVRGDKAPIFCVVKNTTEYNDGTVDSCLGLGYKVYHYKRENYKAIEFGPMWGKDRSNEE